jgi:protein-disulfide isomerase
MDKEKTKAGWTVAIIFILIIILAAWGITALSKKSNTTSPTTSSTSSDQPTTVSTSIGDSPYLGDKNKAKIAIVEFSDFECPYCQQFFEQEFSQVISTFVNTNQAIFVYRDFMGVGTPAAETDSNAGLCVRSLTNNQAYFKMAQTIYENTGLEGKGIATSEMLKLAASAGADQTKFQSCLSADTFNKNIQQDTIDATNIGVTGTPSFVIGKLDASGNVTGDLLVGVEPLTTFQSEVSKFAQ